MNKARVFAAAMIGVLAFTGCAQSPTHVAVVDGTVITQAEVEAGAEILAPVVGGTASQIIPKLVEFDIKGLIAQKVAADNKIELTDAARAPYLAADPALAALNAKPEGRALAARIADLNIVVAELKESFVVACADVPVVLNPAMGSWSGCTLSPTGGSLSLPAPKATTPAPKA